jgi:hypothetical protein
MGFWFPCHCESQMESPKPGVLCSGVPFLQNFWHDKTREATHYGYYTQVQPRGSNRDHEVGGGTSVMLTQNHPERMGF